MGDFGGRPVVDLEIDGKGPFRFILDTGATVTVIDRSLNEQLSLPAAPGFHAAPASGGEAPSILLIPEVRIGQAVLRELIAAILPRSPLRGESSPRGVLSASAFPGYLLTFDYPGKRIFIRKGELDVADDQSTFQYEAGDDLPTVPVRVAGRETRVHLDTGSGLGLTLPTKFLKELPLDSEPKEEGTAKTAGGEYPMSRAKLKGSVEIGKYELELSEVTFSDARPGSRSPTGNIGYGALRDFVVTLDSKNRRIRLDR